MGDARFRFKWTMLPERGPARVAMFACAAILSAQAIRAILYPFLTTGEDLGPDGLSYWHQSLLYAAGSFPWADAGTHWPPLYPLLCGLAMKITGTTLLVPRLLNVVAWSGCVTLTGLLGAQVGSPLIGAVAATTFALDDLFFYIKFVQYELLLTALGTAATVLALRAVDGKVRVRGAFGAGVVTGLAAFAHSKLLPLVVVYAVAIVTARDSTKAASGAPSRERRKNALAYIAGALLALTPWTIRNALVAHRLVVVSSNGPRTFLWGNNRYATGMMVVPGDIRKVEGTGSEDEQHARMMAHGLRFIRTHTAVWLCTIVPSKLWHFLDLGNTRRAHLVVWLTLVGLCWGSLGGVVSHPFLLAATPALLATFSLLFHGEGRYRYPALPQMHVLCAVAIVGLARCACCLAKRGPVPATAAGPARTSAPLAKWERIFLYVSVATFVLVLLRAYWVSPPRMVAAEIWWQGDGKLHLRAWANDATPIAARLGSTDSPVETATLVMDDQGHHHTAVPPPARPGAYTLTLGWTGRSDGESVTLHFLWPPPPALRVPPVPLPPHSALSPAAPRHLEMTRR